MIFRRGKSRRVRMAEALRSECDPVAFSLGFRHPRKGDWDRWQTTRRNVYIRWRGYEYDEVTLEWARFGRPWFRVDFSTSVVIASSGDEAWPVRLVTSGRIDAWSGFESPRG